MSSLATRPLPYGVPQLIGRILWEIERMTLCDVNDTTSLKEHCDVIRAAADRICQCRPSSPQSKRIAELLAGVTPEEV